MSGNQGETPLKNISTSLSAEELRGLIEIPLALLLKYLVIFPLEEKIKCIQNSKIFSMDAFQAQPLFCPFSVSTVIAHNSLLVFLRLIDKIDKR